MERLESIVESMESGKMPLEDLIHRYEEGVALVATCLKKLTAAEKRIKILSRKADSIELQDFDPAAESTPSPAPSPSKPSAKSSTTESDDEISLF